MKHITYVELVISTRRKKIIKAVKKVLSDNNICYKHLFTEKRKNINGRFIDNRTMKFWSIVGWTGLFEEELEKRLDAFGCTFRWERKRSIDVRALYIFNKMG